MPQIFIDDRFIGGYTELATLNSRGQLTSILARGGRYTLDGFSSTWQKLMTTAIKDKVLEQRFTFHDLRAKAGGESENAQDLLGHDDPRTTKRVCQLLRRVNPVAFQ